MQTLADHVSGALTLKTGRFPLHNQQEPATLGRPTCRQLLVISVRSKYGRCLQSITERRELGRATNQSDVGPKQALQVLGQERDTVCDCRRQTSLFKT